jgi:heme-degrading monooxygenase HmoA
VELTHSSAQDETTRDYRIRVIAMIFEYWFDPADDAAYEGYLEESSRLRELLPDVEGFLGIERYASEKEPRHFVAIGFFTDETAVESWRSTAAHRQAQGMGRSRFFAGYRLRMAEVIRDYGSHDRDQAPADSRRVHG